MRELGVVVGPPWQHHRVNDEGRRASSPALVLKSDGSRRTYEGDALVVEEPLEIRLREGTSGASAPFVVTMRTPGHDEDLSMGLLFSEGVISSADEVLDMRRPEDPRIAAELARNVLVVSLIASQDGGRGAARRATVMGSACGVCGRVSIEDVLKLRRRAGDREILESAPTTVAPAVLISLPETLRRHQAVFASTGGLHAAGLFTTDGSATVVREDVGRHNAADKVIGAAMRERRPPSPVLLVSGRLAFEIVQKAVLAHIPIVAAVSAPTSLAVDLAEEAGITLVGFLRGDRFNTYTHQHRILNEQK